MSLSTLETAVVEYVSDVLQVECGRPAPDRILRYHTDLPDDCCSDDGTLAVSWAEEHPSSTFPNSSAAAQQPCPGIPVVTLRVQYVVCWPAPQADASGVQLRDADWDETSAMLADVADNVSRALMRLSCDPDRNDPLVAAVLTEVPRNWVRFVDVTPRRPQGGCAGIIWRLYAGIRSGAEAS